MPTWFDIIKISDFPIDARKVVIIDGISIVLFNLEGNYYAIRNQCTHQDFPLAEGPIENGIITCPFHGAQFSIITGEVKAPPAFEDITTYNVRIENDWIQIAL